MSRTLLLLLLLVLPFARSLSQTVRLSGELKDGFLHTPLLGVKVSAYSVDSVLLIDSLRTVVFYGVEEKVRKACFDGEVDTRGDSVVLLKASRLGYEDAWHRVSMKGAPSVDVGTIEMRRSVGKLLKQATVTATKVKMYYKGDTLVYDADAFKLPDGSMLGALINQLPGVRINESGEIFVQGRKVDELLLGSRTFMRGNKKVLMDNLPYYTVKHVKVYDKQTDLSRALGYDAEPRSYVMDVQLKREYDKGYIANVEAAAGTQDRYLARGFALGFTDRLRLSLLANSNNVSEERHIGQGDQWSPEIKPQSIKTIHGAKADVNYQRGPDGPRNNLYVEFEQSKDESFTVSRREQFLEGISPLSLSVDDAIFKTRKFVARNNFTVFSPFYLTSQTELNNYRRDNTSSSSLDNSNGLPVSSLYSNGLSESRETGFSHFLSTAIRLGETESRLHMSFVLSYTSSETLLKSSFQKKLFYGPLGETASYNSSDASFRGIYLSGSLNYAGKVFGNYQLSGGVGGTFNRNRSSNYLYHPDTLMLPSNIDMFLHTLDPLNTYRYLMRLWECRPFVEFSRKATYQLGYVRVNYSKWYLRGSVPVFFRRYEYFRKYDYPIVERNIITANLDAGFKKRWDNRVRTVQADISHQIAAPSIDDLVDYTDTSTPLVVKKGNSALRGRETTKVTASYDRSWGRYNQAYRTELRFIYNHRDIAQASTYDAATGTYTYQPRNISGAYFANAKADFSRAFDKARRWTVQTTTEADYRHALDHARFTGEPESRVNAVNTFMLAEHASLQYARPGVLTVKALVDAKWRHARGKLLSFSTLDAFDYQYGLSGSYTIRPINLTLMADAHMFSRRGYGSTSLNSDDFVINASLSQSLFKGKLIVKLDGFDLLHQISNTRYEVNAQGRLETWTRSLPRYAMLHIVYHWNKNPKKR